MKTATKVYLIIMCSQLGTMGVAICYLLADMWLTEGRGLHPYMVIPIGIFLGLVPYVICSYWFEPEDDDRHDTSTISLHHPADYAKRERL